MNQSTAYGWLMLSGICISLLFWRRVAQRDSRLFYIYLGALGGAFLGAKVIYMAAEGWLRWHDPNRWLEWATGKTILGGLLGGYAGVKAGFDDKDKPCLRCVRADGVEVEVAGLSDGTRDQLYLSLRLASLLRRVEVADPMPLVLDDVLIQLDDARASAALGVHAEVARKILILFFTHHARLVDLARALENACFDYLMIEDSLMVSDTYRGTMEYSLAHGAGAPKNDPMPMVPLIAQATSKIGIIATMATSFYPPFTAARLGATLDHLTKGRVGINIVTASSHRSAQNYGFDQHIEHDERYLMADEWMQVCYALWSSWEPGAVVANRDHGVFADFSKVHTIDFKGKYYSCRGPLNTAPGPQGRPVICQALFLM